MTIEFALLIVAAYLVGSVPAAYLVSKWFHGIDLRQYGSGNVGASNLLRLTSKRFAIPVIIFDTGKGMAMVWAAQLLGLGAAGQVTAGMATIMGHNWPVFLRFQGGHGILTSLGVVIMLAPILALIVLVLAFLFAPFKQLALGVLIGLVSLPIFSWLLGQTLPITLGFLVILLIAVFRRLVAPPTSLTASVTRGQLLVNRLLFDRDIRDREAWISRKPLE